MDIRFTYLFYISILHTYLPHTPIYRKRHCKIKSKFMVQFFSKTLCLIYYHSRLTSSSKLVLYSKSGTIINHNKRFIWIIDFTCMPMMNISLCKGSTVDGYLYPCQINTFVMNE